MAQDPVQYARPQISLKWLLIAVGLLGAALTTARCAMLVLETPNDAYAMWAAGDVLLRYMRDTDCGWPRTWDELADHHAKSGAGTTMIGPFSEMQNRIHIDFTFDPKAALESIDSSDVTPTFRVVQLKNGSDTHWSGREPNQGIFDFLKARKFTTTTAR